ncbi:DUF6531 domain-containing protein [Paraburkholderia saeva]|uniref:DUF6531 domain-containing protein n=1 Tax=Paraburkholderia saeva TaxID=2777537 RepID=UPI001E525E79|nr:DUF6531 domain-containing protein [Paraburkholderia saeva]
MNCKLKAAAGNGGMGGYACLNNIGLIEAYCSTSQAVQPEASCPVADPVYPATGSVLLSETDFVSGGDTPIAFKRTYRSSPFLRPNTLVGAMWFHNWQRQLVLGNATGSSPEVTAYREDGDKAKFRKVNGAWVQVGGATLTLASTGSTWTVTDRLIDSRETYSGQGVLMSVTTHEGRVASLTYSDASTPRVIAPKNGLLVAITEHSPENFTTLNLTISFTYDSKGHLSTLTDPGGVVTQYGYDAYDNLTSVTWPDGYTRRYVYTDKRFPGNLTGIIDETGSRIATWTYDEKGRATAVTHPDTTQNAQFSYDSGATTVTDRRGSTAMNYSLVAGAQRPTDIVGPTGRTSNMKWDASGNLLSKVGPDGNSSELTYDTANRPIRQEIRDSSGTTVTSVRYSDATSLRAWQIAQPGMLRTFVYDGNGNLTGIAEQTTDDPTGANGFDAKSANQLRTYGLTYDRYDRNSFTLVTTNGIKESEWIQNYDGTGNRSLLTNRVASQTFGVAVRDAAHRPVQVIGPGFIAYPSYDVRGRVKQFAYVEQASASNGYISRRFTVDYIYTPDGRVASRSATVQPDGNPPTAMSSDETDQLLSNFEEGINPAGPPQGRLGRALLRQDLPEPGLEPVCVECFLYVVTRNPSSAVGWIASALGKGCKPTEANNSAVVSFKTDHYAPRLQQSGLNVGVVEARVAEEVAGIKADMIPNTSTMRRLTVDGVLIEFRAYMRADGQVNVGTIFPVK